RHKHWDIKWRKLRAEKVMKMDLPDYDKLRRESMMDPSEFRSKMKKEGMTPPRRFQERPIIIASTGSVFEPYVPPEGDGLASRLSGKGAKQRLTELEMKGKSFLQLRKIKPYEENFDIKVFAEKSLDIYKEAMKLLEKYDNEARLHELVSEKAYPEMVWKLEKKTFRWSFIESLEPPRVVHVRTTEMMSKENIYAQITVRYLTKQMIAIYDRFGRLTYGSETIPQDLLEYVVFEKHIVNENGSWRVHSKIFPDWMKTGDYSHQVAVLRTMVKPKLEAIDRKVDVVKSNGESGGSDNATGQLAAA
ncbi:hypothetical protein HELRODRAFT_72310, partial [Helobdella robusta]|uniref:Large ribosomal subunit protein mL45 n=1 Tax=Helobdella robusta TaxID=6412 RepID=T1G0Y1_HELRO